MDKTRKITAALMILFALGLLYPGVTQPVLSLSGTIEKSQIATLGIDMMAGEDADNPTRQMLTSLATLMGLDQIEGQVLAYQSTRSIWGTASELARTGNLLVAILIVFFSMVIPVFKLLLQLSAILIGDARIRQLLLGLNAALSKWSMADVFVMGLLVAFLAGSASSEMGDLLTMDAQLEVGFYYFLAYCLSSIAVSSLLRSDSAKPLLASA